MRSHRLDRLARLTQGAALLGLGVTSLACTKDHPPTINAPPDQPHINATATPVPSASTPTAPPPDAPHVNATATPVPSASAAPHDVHVNATGKPPHVNAPPKKP